MSRPPKAPESSRLRLAAITSGLLLIFCAQVAAAQAVDPRLWSTDPGWTVTAIARSENTLYFGGSFKSVGPSTGGGVPVSERNGTPASVYPKVAGEVAEVISDGHGGWFIGGTFTGVGGLPRRNLAHILADGSVADWNPDPDGTIVALALVRNILYVGGDFFHIDDQPRRSLAAFDIRRKRLTRWNPDPGPGPPNSAEYGTVWAILPRGHVVYVGGSFASIGGEPRRNLAAVSARTGRPTAWDPQADSWVRALATHGNTLFAGGYFYHVRGQPRSLLAAIDLDTGEATAWDAHVARVPEDYYFDGGPRVLDLEVADNTLYVAGSFSSIGGQPRGGLAALDVRTGEATCWDPQALGWNVSDPTRPYFSSVVVHQSAIYAAGEFRSLGGQEGSSNGVGYVGAVDMRTGLACSWNPRPNGIVLALGANRNGIFVGGSFTSLRDWVPRRGLAALDLRTGALTPWDPGCDGLVRSLVISGNSVYVGGQFSTVGGQSRANLAALDASSGSATTWNPGASGPLWALTLDGNTLYAGGWFNQVGGEPRQNIAAIDATSGLVTPWNPSANDIVQAIAVNDGTVYAGGWFSTIGGSTRRSIAALDQTTAIATAWNPDGDGTVSTLVVGDEAVYVGGFFRTMGGQSRYCLAAIDQVSGLVTPWNPTPVDDRAESEIRSLAASNGAIYVGGRFRSIDGVTRNRLAAIDPTTAQVLDWNPDPDEQVWCLAAAGNRLYAGGSFSRMGVVPASGVSAMTLTDAPIVDVPTPSTSPILALAQNAPNPARATTSIRFTLPAAAPVTLAVFDVQGRRVATLLDRALQPAGQHEATVRTDGWSAGCYLYRLEAGATAMTRKMLVVK